MTQISPSRILSSWAKALPYQIPFETNLILADAAALSRRCNNAGICSIQSARSSSSSSSKCQLQFSTLAKRSISNSLSGNSSLITKIYSLVSTRYFQSVAEYHQVADATLEEIQDVLDEFFERMPASSSRGNDHGEFEVSYSSGVLTIVMPPHGTWVLNKQTPNQQIWWSSPLSGPRRYEYENGQWVYTRSGTPSSHDAGSAVTLGETLKDEVHQLFHVELDL